MKKLSLILFIGLLLISIMSITGCGGEGCTACGTYSYSPASERSSSSSDITTEESSSSSIGESSSSSSGIKQVPISSSSISSSSVTVVISDGTCDSLITPFTRTYSSYIFAYTNEVGYLEVNYGSSRGYSNVTLEVRKDSTFLSYGTAVYKIQNVSCELTDGELRIYDVDKSGFISDTNGVWDMYHEAPTNGLYDYLYYMFLIMGDSPYIDPIYWEQD